MTHEYLDGLMRTAAHLATILVVEDCPELVALLRQLLGDEGYAVRFATDGESGLTSALEDEPDLLILDVGLPYRNGLEIVQELRRRGVTAPTLMLTALGGIADRVTGLEAGADDYMVKPFDTDELIARVRALLRRAATQPGVPRLCVGDLVLDPLTRRSFRGQRELVLTQREFSLLEFLMKNAGRPLTRRTIANRVWSQAQIDPDETNIVDVYVAYLRKKLDAGGESQMLQTVRGVGYMLCAC